MNQSDLAIGVERTRAKMNRSRSTLCRSFSDSGCEVTTPDSDMAYYNGHMLLRQKADAMLMKDDLRTDPHALERDNPYSTRADSLLAGESRACVMDHSLGVLDMVLDSMSRELEVPLTSNYGHLYCNTPPLSADSDTSMTSLKSIDDSGDIKEVDDTEVKRPCRGSCSETDVEGDVTLRPPAYGDLSDDEVRHLMDSVGGLHKKLDVLHSKMNNLLQQKAGKQSSDEKQLQTKEKTDSGHPYVTQKSIEFTARQGFGKKMFPMDSVYVQIEQVYYNLQRMNFVQRSGNSVLKKFPNFSPTNKASKETFAAATQTSTDPDDDIASLKERCDSLEKENASLSEELNKLKPVQMAPPVPAPRQSKDIKKSQLLEDCHRRMLGEQDSLYTLVTCVAGAPTPPPKTPPLPKDIRMTEVIYEWTITDYAKQFQEQRSGRMHKTTSAPFFITHNGYRARMEAYLDGDGSHKGSSLSVFLRILPGEMDDQLPWPAHLKLSFILVNHSDKPDEENKSRRSIVEHRFCRPKGRGLCEEEDGDCWGVLNLVSHEKIRSQQFIRKDKLLLQCRVHILSAWKRNKKSSS